MDTIRFYLLFAALLFSFPLLAQTNSDYDIYLDRVGNEALFLRGRQPMKYQFKYNGTFYAYSPDYERGIVVYNGKSYGDVLVNLNCHTEELCVKRLEGNLPVSLSSDYVESFSMGERRFVFLRNTGDSNVPDGYYEVLHDGAKARLYKHISKFYYEELNSFNATSSSGIERAFMPEEKFLVCKDSHYYQIKKNRSLYKLFPEYKSALRKMTIKYESKEDFFKRALNYIETN